MASSGKQKTTTSKRVREAKLRERRIEKQAKKDARKLAASDRADALADASESPTTGEADSRPQD
jgi:vacuolar-type H+-ATPase subunit H